MNMREMILAVLAKYGGRWVTTQVITQTIVRSPEMAAAREKNPEVQRLETAGYPEGRITQKLEREIQYKVMLALAKLVKLGFVRRTNLLGKTPSQRQKLGLVFSEPRQLMVCQSAFHITGCGQGRLTVISVKPTCTIPKGEEE